MLGTIQITGEDLNDVEVNDICNSLRKGSVRLLSLRGCHIDDADFKRITDSLKGNSSLVQLNFSLGVLSNKQRVKWLSDSPKITSLDVGDCNLTDDALQQICTLLPPEEGKTSLHTLTLTGNKNISQMGWSYLAIAIAASSCLHNLYLDYNKIGNYGAGVLAVAMAASATLEKIDFEGCSITESGAELLFDVVANYPTSLKEINLSDNDVSEELLEQIKQCLIEDDSEDEIDSGGATK